MAAAAGERALRSLRELAAAEGMDRGYVARQLQLTLLAPKIVHAALDGSMCLSLELLRLADPSAALWELQHEAFTPRSAA